MEDRPELSFTETLGKFSYLYQGPLKRELLLGV